MDFIWTIISTPQVAEWLGIILVGLLAFGGKRIMALVNLAWAEKYMMMAGSHLHNALQRARMHLVEKLKEANSDGIITKEEREAALKDALAIFWDAVSSIKLAESLSTTSGSKWLPEEAKEWGNDMVAAALVDVEKDVVSPTLGQRS